MNRKRLNKQKQSTGQIKWYGYISFTTESFSASQMNVNNLFFSYVAPR